MHLTMGPNDRVLGAAVGISILLHGVLLSVHFKFPDPLKWKPSEQPLEVVLVNAKTRERPSRAQILAQANLDRGGNVDENRRAKIAELNDQVRKDAGLPTSHFQATNPHRVLITAGIAALPLEDQTAICRRSASSMPSTTTMTPTASTSTGSSNTAARASSGRSTTTIARSNTAARTRPIPKRPAAY